MQDRFLFRGKCIISKEWIYGSLEWVQNEPPYIGHAGNEYNSFYEVHGETVGQCTGLKDRNGELIFEGDILQCSYNSIGMFEGNIITTRHYVKWGDVGSFKLYPIGDANEFEKFCKSTASISEIIGNIHDTDLDTAPAK